MPIASGEIALKEVTLDIRLLPIGSRVITPITITAAAAGSAGAQTISLSSSAACAIKAGSGLSFIRPTTPTTRQLVRMREPIALSTTAGTAQVFPLLDAVAISSVATWYDGMVSVMGLQSFALNSQDQTVDTTSTESGSGTEMAIIRKSRKFQISGIMRPFDEGFYGLLQKVGLGTEGLLGRELFCIMTRPNGEVHRGPAKVSNLQRPGGYNEVDKYSFDLDFMGDFYEYVQPYIFN